MEQYGYDAGVFILFIPPFKAGDTCAYFAGQLWCQALPVVSPKRPWAVPLAAFWALWCSV